MKKLTMLLAVATICCTQAFAQTSNSTDREQRRTELIGKWAERWSKDFELTGDKKARFEKLFAEYQNEMFSTNRGGSRETAARTTEQETKELTAEEVTQKLQESIQNQEEMITRMQKRLEIQKKYQTEFGKILTPHQVLKVVSPAPRNQSNATSGDQRGNRNRGGGMGGFGRPGGSRNGF